MLTSDQKECIESGEILDKNMMQRRIRRNLSNTMVDLNFVLNHHSMIEGESEIEQYLNHTAITELIYNLLYLVDERYIDENLLWMLVEQAEDSWSVPGGKHVHGEKEELVIDIFLTVFEEYDPEDDMSPPPQNFERWDDMVEEVEELDNF